METLVKRSPQPARSGTVTLPAALLADPTLDLEAVRLYAELARYAGWRTSAPPDAEHLRARLALENAGWLLVHRAEGVTVLVLLNTRNVDALDAIREAFPESTPTDAPEGSPAASDVPQGSLALDGEAA